MYQYSWIDVSISVCQFNKSICVSLFTNNNIYQYVIIYNNYFSSSLYNVSWVWARTKVISVVAYICAYIFYYIFTMVTKPIYYSKPVPLHYACTACNHTFRYLLVLMFLNTDGSASTGTKWNLKKWCIYACWYMIGTNTGLAPLFGGPPWDIASTMGH